MTRLRGDPILEFSLIVVVFLICTMSFGIAVILCSFTTTVI